METDTNSAILRAAVGFAIATACIVCLVISVLWPDAGWQLYARYGLPSTALAFAFVLAVPSLLPMANQAAYHWRETKKHLVDASQLGSKPLARRPRIIDQVDPRAVMWQEYWLAAIKYSEDVGGLEYLKMAEFFGSDHGTWNGAFIKPFLISEYIYPLQRGVPTSWRAGWTAETVRWRLEAGIGWPTYPAGLPPEPFQSWKLETGQKAETSPNSGETVPTGAN